MQSLQFSDEIQREFSLPNSGSPLSNRQRQFWRRDVIAARGSPMRTWVRVAVTLQCYWIFCARTYERKGEAETYPSSKTAGIFTANRV